MKTKPPARREVRAPDAPARPRWFDFLVQQAAGYAISPLLRLVAALLLGFAIVLLSAGWLAGPQRMIDALQYRSYTAPADGRIVDSWLAIEFDARAQGDRYNWYAGARGSACAVVEYDGDWGAPQRRAYCGNRLDVHASDNLARFVDTATMAPGVPFAMPRDARGFATPELRIDRATHDWLERHASHESRLDGSRAANAFVALRELLDRPLDDALAGWSAATPAFPLLLDPQHPGEAMPRAWVDSHRAGAGIESAFAWLLLAGGAWLWLRGMRWLMMGLPRAAVLFAAIAPLLLLPWWGERMPMALAHVNADMGEIIGDMLADLDRTGRLVASTPAQAALAGGEQLVWRVGEGADADTLGKLPFALPQPRPANADGALRALVAQATDGLRALDAEQRSALLQHLTRDKHAGRYGAGWLFLPGAVAALDDGDAGLARAARDFLEAWVTQPVDEPYPEQPGFAVRVELLRPLAALPIPEIAIMAGSIVERATARAR